MAPFDAPVSAPSGPKEDHRDTNNTAQVGFALPADRQRPETLNKYYATGTHAFDDRIWSHILVRVIDRVRAVSARVRACSRAHVLERFAAAGSAEPSDHSGHTKSDGPGVVAEVGCRALVVVVQFGSSSPRAPGPGATVRSRR